MTAIAIARDFHDLDLYHFLRVERAYSTHTVYRVFCILLCIFMINNAYIINKQNTQRRRCWHIFKNKIVNKLEVMTIRLYGLITGGILSKTWNLLWHYLDWWRKLRASNPARSADKTDSSLWCSAKRQCEHHQTFQCGLLTMNNVSYWVSYEHIWKTTNAFLTFTKKICASSICSRISTIGIDTRV